jgi:hypothetical protein
MSISAGVRAMADSDADVDVLARAMIRNFPADAAGRAASRASMFAALGRIETSCKWSRVSEEISRIQTGSAA